METRNGGESRASEVATSIPQLDEQFQVRKAHRGAFVDAPLVDAAVVGTHLYVTVELGSEDVTFAMHVNSLDSTAFDVMRGCDALTARYADDEFSRIEVEGDDGGPYDVVDEIPDGDAVRGAALEDAANRLRNDIFQGDGPLTATFRTIEVEDGEFVADVEIAATDMEWRVDLDDGIPSELQALADAVGDGSIRGIEGAEANVTPRPHVVYPSSESSPIATIQGPVVHWHVFATIPFGWDIVKRVAIQNALWTSAIIGGLAAAPFFLAEHMFWDYTPFPLIPFVIGFAFTLSATDLRPSFTYFPSGSE